MAPTVLVVQHHEDSPAGLVGETIAEAGGRLVTLRGDRGERVPHTPDGLDGLVLLGGAMSANDDADWPHFPALRRLARDFAAAGMPVLGLCLGAQMLAQAHGARVERHDEVEFGFWPLRLTEAGASDPLLRGLAPAPRLMQFHEDRFELPEGAALLMTGEGCRNQAFRIGDRTWGFQCHLEVTAATVRSWALIRAGQTGAAPETMREAVEAELARHMAAADRFGRTVARRWFELVRARAGAGAPA
jgi:GMP synthase (glutamine-hydrolysing)